MQIKGVFYYFLEWYSELILICNTHTQTHVGDIYHTKSVSGHQKVECAGFSRFWSNNSLFTFVFARRKGIPLSSLSPPSLSLSVCGKGKYLHNQLNFIVKFILWIINDFLQVVHVATESPQIAPPPLYIYMHNTYLSVSIYQRSPQTATNFKNLQHFNNAQRPKQWGMAKGCGLGGGGRQVWRYMNK